PASPPGEDRPEHRPEDGPLPRRALTATNRALTRVGLTSRADRFLVAAVAAWLLWAGISTLIHGSSVALLSPYLTAPVIVLLGVVAGRALAARAPGRLVATGSAVVALAVLFAIPFYANAQAALGIQLVALTGLIALADTPADPVRPRSLTLPLPAILALVLGALLAARAQAGTVLVIAVAAVLALAVARDNRPARRRLPAPRTVVAAGMVVIAAAALAVVWLGTRGAWPSLLTSSGSLSSTRHMLWGDALKLWEHNPVLGSGPGSFLDASPLAGTREHLHEAHSSILQVGAELGILGVLLFLALLAAGLAVAAQYRGPASLVAVAAWTALAVHSMIDHLYEFPPLTFAAGLVLGYGAAAAPGAAAPGPAARTRTPSAPRSP
ncbi:MAG: O-antigen ligase family protein, partial [Actinomycetales bacterium]